MLESLQLCCVIEILIIWLNILLVCLSVPPNSQSVYLTYNNSPPIVKFKSIFTFIYLLSPVPRVGTTDPALRVRQTDLTRRFFIVYVEACCRVEVHSSEREALKVFLSLI